VLLERGAFTADDSAATGLLLMAYVMMMVGTSVAGLLSQLFFATRNVAVLNLTLLSGLGIQIVVTFLLLDSLGALAVALGTGIGVVTSATVLWWTVSRRLLGKSLLAMIGRDVLEFGATGLIMGVVWKVGERIASGFGGEAISPVEYFLSLSVATAAYLGVCHAFGGRELSSLVARIRSRGGMD
jgi:putative peptidoglycan lipid II flippase